MGWGLFSLWQNITSFSFGGPEFFEGLMTKLRIVSNSPLHLSARAPGTFHFQSPGLLERIARNTSAPLHCQNRPMHKFVHYLNPVPSQLSAATFVARHLGHTIHSSVSPVYSILPNRTWKHQYLTCILTTLTLDVKQHAMYWEDTVATQDAFHSHHGCTRLQPSWIGAQIVAILPSCSISLSLCRLQTSSTVGVCMVREA